MLAFEQFMEYKARVPVRGAILLNEEMDSAVLVKGWKKGANWSFPRGKINKDEDDLVCAIREVYEETGYDLMEAGLVPADRNVKSIKVNMRDQQMQLFVFRDVPMDTYFEPRTRKEISKIQWWRLSDLPAFRKKGQEHEPAGSNANKFYMVAPFLVPLRKWVQEEKKKDGKRCTSKQHLPAGLRGDDPLTEDDRGVESAGPSHVNEGISRGMPDQSSMEDASAALNRLLRIQQPQELQAESSPAPQPVNKVGDALLALLQNKPSPAGQQAPKNAPPHTPLSNSIGQPQMPPTPQHFPPRPPQFSSMPPPPVFPNNFQQPEAFSYQLPKLPPYSQQSVQQNNSQPQQPPSGQYQNPHSHQPPQLVHPQPLPPNVQRAVFTGGSVHAPMVPPPQQMQQLPLHQSFAMAVHSPLVTGLHSTMTPPQAKKTPPKLNSHSLALLNAFKLRDQTLSETPTTLDLPLRDFTLKPQQIPQELSADTTQKFPEHLLQTGQSRNGHAAAPPTVVARPAISETQRSTLLGLFKSPTTQAFLPAEPLGASALPPSSTPSAVELSAAEPLSTNAAVTSALLNDKRVPDQVANIGTKLSLPSGTQMPFRPVGILPRPVELSEEERPLKYDSAQKTRSNGKKTTQVPKAQIPRPEKPVFQPQILKRPQSGTPKIPEGPVSSVQSPVASHSSFDRPFSTPEHAQNLLSLFCKSPARATPLSQAPTRHLSVPSGDLMPGLRSGGLTSAGGGLGRGSQTPISPADTGFLLSYLDEVANGVQR